MYQRILGVREPESDIRATNRFDDRGRFRGEVTPFPLKGRLDSGRRTARYDHARCPALAVYAVPDSVEDVVPYYRELDATGRAEADSLLLFVRAVVDDSRGKFARLPQHPVVDVRGSNHYLFLEYPDEVERAMRALLNRFGR